MVIILIQARTIFPKFLGIWPIRKSEWAVSGGMEVSEGFLMTNSQFFRTDSGAEHGCAHNKDPQELKATYQAATAADPSVYGAPAIDAVCMFAKALHEMLEVSMMDIFQNIRFTGSELPDIL